MNLLIICGIGIIIISLLLLIFVSKNENVDRFLWCLILLGLCIAIVSWGISHYKIL